MLLEPVSATSTVRIRAAGMVSRAAMAAILGICKQTKQ